MRDQVLEVHAGILIADLDHPEAGLMQLLVALPNRNDLVLQSRGRR